MYDSPWSFASRCYSVDFFSDRTQIGFVSLLGTYLFYVTVFEVPGHEILKFTFKSVSRKRDDKEKSLREASSAAHSARLPTV